MITGGIRLDILGLDPLKGSKYCAINLILPFIIACTILINLALQKISM